MIETGNLQTLLMLEYTRSLSKQLKQAKVIRLQAITQDGRTLFDKPIRRPRLIFKQHEIKVRKLPRSITLQQSGYASYMMIIADNVPVLTMDIQTA